MLSKSNKLISYTQKSLCQMATTSLYPRRQRVSKQQENYRAAFGSDALD